ncbi:MAG: DNA mismatch repair protein MutS [Flavobacteriales bacterium]|nr:MAG: DNA mismatch repair protein MutS [Flavobacteriales bacterium]
MQAPADFYKYRKDIFNRNLQQYKKQLTLSGTLRLLTFTGLVLAIYFFYSNLIVLIPISVVLVALFLFLLVRHQKLVYKRDYARAMISINETEIEALNGKYFHLPNGDSYKNPHHDYSYDIDLFGTGSFFQYLNRTATTSGKDNLAKLLTQYDIENIPSKQKAIKELSLLPEWRQDFTAIAQLANVKEDKQVVLNFIKNHKTELAKTAKLLPIIFSVLSLLIIALIIANIISAVYLIFWIFIGLGTTGVYLKKINRLYENAGNAKATFNQYYKLLNQIEQAAFSTDLLKQQQQKIKTDSEKASGIFRKFSKILDAFDQRNNLIIGLIGNALFLRDLHQANRVEKWIKKYGQNAAAWFRVIAFFDAYNSMANFTYNHPDYVFPGITTGENIIQSKQFGHPLLPEANRINNDFTITSDSFFIITGANMAGKSTFLRTVSLAIVMANLGLPVCAEKFTYKPIKLITSMRTSDSLTDNESYFFAELKRLKFIVKSIEKDNYFIVLDEILKGTNSTDKALGSMKFVKRLISTHSSGIIATHDLSLCEISAAHPEVENYYFDAEIIDDELHFDYRLKKGVCKNMNASFLLKKMEIV